MKTEYISIRIPKEDKERLKQAAKDNGRTVSNYVLWIIQEKLNRKNKEK